MKIKKEPYPKRKCNKDVIIINAKKFCINNNCNCIYWDWMEKKCKIGYKTSGGKIRE